MEAKREWSFDIDRAIETWRQFVSGNPSIREADLEELELHLMDEWESLTSGGMDPEKAFEQARRDLGNLSDLQMAYGDVHVEKMFWKGRTRTEMDVLKTTAGSYIRSAWRDVVRNKGYAALNIVGLALALGSSLIIGLFVRQSLSYDKHHEFSDSTYRVVMDRDFPGENSDQAYVAPGLADLIRSEWAGAEYVTQMTGRFPSETLLTVDDSHFMSEGVMQVDEHFLDIFSASIIESTGPAPLEAPQSMILTESTARRLFGSNEALGQNVRLDARRDFTVTAIVEDPPPNTHLPFNVLVRGFTSPATLSWNSIGNYIYVVLPGAQSASGLSQFLTQKFESENPGAIGAFYLQPIQDIHLRSGVQDDYAPQGDIRYLLIFLTIGILILVLASINYVNLATARADRRVREVGIRKVVGASGGQLRGQFLLQSLLITLLSVPLALLLAALVLPMLSSLLGESLPYSMLLDPVMWLVMGLLIFAVSVGAGIYPAVLMARKNPVEVFAGSRSFGRARITLRQILVGTQVAIAFSLIVITLVIAGQLDFIRSNRLGFDTDQVVLIRPQGWSGSNFATFQSDLAGHSSVQSAAAGIPIGLGFRYFAWSQTMPADGTVVDFESIPVGIGYIETMGLDLIEGRTFSDLDLNAETPPLIVSQSYVDAVGASSSVIGTEIESGNGGTIIGVVGEFKNASFTENKKVAMLRFDPEMTRYAVVKLNGDQIQEGLQAMKSAWAKISPDRPMNFTFLDDRIQSQYEEEVRLGSIFNIFSLLSIIIASLGLFGLAELTARQRDKEIAIRKSQGASEMNILTMLVKEFILIVMAGITLALPLVWIYSSNWLAGFSEHIQLSASLFLTSALICLSFVALAVVLRSMKAARANPVGALSWE